MPIKMELHINRLQSHVDRNYHAPCTSVRTALQQASSENLYYLTCTLELYMYWRFAVHLQAPYGSSSTRACMRTKTMVLYKVLLVPCMHVRQVRNENDNQTNGHYQKITKIFTYKNFPFYRTCIFSKCTKFSVFTCKPMCLYEGKYDNNQKKELTRVLRVVHFY